jgi:hypothetical protein
MIKKSTQFLSKLFVLTVVFLLYACAPLEPTTLPATPPATAVQTSTPNSGAPAMDTEGTPMKQSQFADVLSVQVTGNQGTYQFAVELASPDTGCEQYADWWEVISQDGELLYRRILLHSHVDEQPFTRSGGPVEVAADDVVYVRAHMNTSGYGGHVLKGTIRDGFEPAEVEADFGSGLERIPPQPEDCAF